MKGRTPTAEERRWLDKITAYGCCVCRMFHIYSPASPHHIDGKTKPGAHLLTIPLCGPHHQIKSNEGRWTSLHGDGRAAFARAYGSELEWLERLRKRLK